MSRRKLFGTVSITAFIVSLTITGGYIYKDHQDKAKSAAINARMMKYLWGKPCHYAPASYNQALAEGALEIVGDTQVVTKD